MNDKKHSNTMILFGGTGDLAKRKVLPALYLLQNKNKLPSNFALVGVARRVKSHEEYRDYIYNFMKKEMNMEIDKEIWKKLSQKIYYSSFYFDDTNGYNKLEKFLVKLEQNNNIENNRIYYLAVAPKHFSIIINQLKNHNMGPKENYWRRVVIEKPFGRDLNSAEELNNTINKLFEEKDIYRIDHYLGKEMLQNITVIRFANTFFEPLWNNKYIDNIQISSNEKLGVGSRGEYYDDTGAIRDMVQNHMMQLLTLVAMEPPNSLDNKSIHKEKINILKSLRKFNEETIVKDTVIGQYDDGIINEKKVKGYIKEKNVDPNSTRETFVALKTYIDNPRWEGVPFYIRTGKRMAKKTTEVVIEFKKISDSLYFNKYEDLEPNLLVIGIQPKEGAFLRFNSKKPNTVENIISVEMDFCQSCNIGLNSPEAYERLILDIIKGDPTLFTNWEEVKYSWDFIDNIKVNWKSVGKKVELYTGGKNGPKSATELLTRDDRKWWNVLGG